MKDRQLRKMLADVDVLYADASGTKLGFDNSIRFLMEHSYRLKGLIEQRDEVHSRLNRLEKENAALRELLDVELLDKGARLKKGKKEVNI